MFDLTNNQSKTLPFQNRSNIASIHLAPNNRTLITVDVDGYALLINLHKQVVVAHLNFKAPVTALAFSPDSKLLFVACGTKVKLFETPSVTRKIYSPLVLYKKYANLHSEEIKGVCFSSDSRFFLTWSRDLTMKLLSVHKLPGFLPITFGGHKKPIVKAWFSEDDSRVMSVGTGGQVAVWRWVEEQSEGYRKVQEFEEQKRGKRLKIGKGEEKVVGEGEMEGWSERERKVKDGRYILEKKTKVTLPAGVRISACVHSSQGQLKLLCVAQTNGVFTLFNLDTLETLQSFQLSETKLSSVALSPNGDWLAIGSKQEGQLIVWEWKSETYILKQQGHFYDLGNLAWSPDGSMIATGAQDGKLKLWTVRNHLCFVTFTEHTSVVTSIQFHPKKAQTLISSSLDGTVRAYDLVKYRCFRVLQAPKPTQFTCLAIEPTGGDLICAGSNEPYEIYVWSLKTGQLLDIMAGHTAPISSLAFNAQGNQLASGSWDHSVRIWDLFERKGVVETLSHSSEVLSLEYRGTEVVSSTLSGQVYTWEGKDGSLKGVLECSKDLAGGRLRDERNTADKSTRNKHLQSVSVSPNGDYLIGGGNSKNICLYDLNYKLLLRRFAITQNRSLDGVLNILNSKDMKEGGVADHELDLDSDLEEDAWHIRNQADQNLPGAQRPNNAQLIKRKTKLAIRIKHVKFSPDGTKFAAATTEGLVIYSLMEDSIFNPYELDEQVTLDSIIDKVKKEEYLQALMYAIRINEREVIDKVQKCVPQSNISLISANFPSNYLIRYLEYLANELENGKDLEWNLLWVKNLLRFQEPVLKKASGSGRAIMLKLYSSLGFYDQSLKKITNENIHMMKFMIKAHEQRKEESTMEQE